MTAPSFTIIIPVHNEAGFMGPALDRIRSQVDAVTSGCWIILVENGSTDSTYREADRLASADSRLEVIRLPEADYGLAVRAGMERAVMEMEVMEMIALKNSDPEDPDDREGSEDRGWLVLFDIDYFSGPFVGRVIEAADHADVVIGSKRAPGARDRRPRLRRLATGVFNFLLRAAVGSGLSDTHGIKAIRTSTAQDLLPEVASTGDLFDTELVLRAERAGYRITEVPMDVEELREARSSLLRRVPRTLRGLAVLRRRLRAVPPPEENPGPGAPRPDH